MDNIFANEIGRLAQGVGRNIKGTNKIYFIKHQETPMNQKSTDGRMVVDCCPQKEEQKQKRLTVDGDLINFTWRCWNSHGLHAYS